MPERTGIIQRDATTTRLAELERERQIRSEGQSRLAELEAEQRRRQNAVDPVANVGFRMTEGVSDAGISALGLGSRAIGDGLAIFGALSRGTGNLTAGEPFNFTEELASEQQRFPASFFRSAPVGAGVTKDLVAKAQALPALMPGGETFTEAALRNRATLGRQDQEIREANPFSSALGDIAGDAAAIALMRQPFARGISAAENALMNPAVQRASTATGLATNLLKSKGFRTLLRGVGRVFETGAEATALDLVRGDDPLETAPYAMAAQAAGSMTVGMARQLMFGGWAGRAKAVGEAAVLGGILSMFGTLTPGDQSSLEGNVQDFLFKAGIAGSIGFLAGAAGMGRLRGTELDRVNPQLADGITAFLRGGAISSLERYVDSPPELQERTQMVLDVFARTPDFFSASQRQAIGRALDRGDIVDQVRALTRDDEFIERLETISGE